jgi:hypothetical protein
MLSPVHASQMKLERTDETRMLTPVRFGRVLSKIAFLVQLITS